MQRRSNCGLTAAVSSLHREISQYVKFLLWPFSQQQQKTYHILSFVSLSLKSLLFYPVSVMFFVFVVVFQIKQRTTVSMSGWVVGGWGGGAGCVSFVYHSVARHHKQLLDSSLQYLDNLEPSSLATYFYL